MFSQPTLRALAHCVLRLLFVCGLFSGQQIFASDGTPPRIGWVYRIEGQLDGSAVVYVGSATDLKQRLSNNHQWARLLQQDDTRVYAREVFAELNVRESNRQTLLSARNEALRAAEQRVIEQARAHAEKVNRKLPPGEPQTRVLNEINASADASTWAVRHRVTTGESWLLIEKRLMSATTKMTLALTLFDFCWMYRAEKMDRYVMAPYVLGDEHGFFTLEQSRSLSSPTYHKVYLESGASPRRVEVPGSEFQQLKEEAESLWGTTDWKGDFVPGLMNRQLPLVERQNNGGMQ